MENPENFFMSVVLIESTGQYFFLHRSYMFAKGLLKVKSDTVESISSLTPEKTLQGLEI